MHLQNGEGHLQKSHLWTATLVLGCRQENTRFITSSWIWRRLCYWLRRVILVHGWIWNKKEYHIQWYWFHFLRHAQFRTQRHAMKTTLINAESRAEPESRKVVNLPPVTISPCQKLPPIVEVLVVDRALLRHGRQSGLSMTNEFEINIV